MRYHVRLCDREIDYSVRRYHRARSLRISIHEGGRIVVSCPQNCLQQEIEMCLMRKSDWIMQTLERVRAMTPVPRDAKSERADFERHKTTAYNVVCQRIERWNAQYGFLIGRITIRNQKTRWGSCSHRGNINFHYKLIRLPDSLIDYVIVHELCHLGELNHSRRFWNLVAKALPHYTELRKQLRQYRIHDC